MQSIVGQKLIIATPDKYYVPSNYNSNGLGMACLTLNGLGRVHVSQNGVGIGLGLDRASIGHSNNQILFSV